MSKALINKLSRILDMGKRYYLGKYYRMLIKHAKDVRQRSARRMESTESKGILLLDAADHITYYFACLYFCDFFLQEYGFKALYVRPRISGYRHPVFKWFYPYSRQARLLKAVGAEFGFDYFDIGESERAELEVRAETIFSGLRSKENVVDISIDGIPVGDLIYDSYLRLYSVPTVEINDSRLHELIEATLIIFHSSCRFLSRHKVDVILATHATYIQHGLLARIAAIRGHRVYTTVTINRVFHKLSKTHFLQTSNHANYRKQFSLLNNKGDKLTEARKALTTRLSGGKDVISSYMRDSAYRKESGLEERILTAPGKPKVVVMLHCFFDSPHIYRNMLFPDFYEWLDFTLDIACHTPFDIYMKPHPNGLPGNENILREFTQKYPRVKIIRKEASNIQLVEEGLTVGISVYGTIAHEFPYLGIPVICAGDHPHSAYNFSHTATSVENYAELIRGADGLSKHFDKSEIEEFYYMHYLYEGDGRLRGNNNIFGYGKPNRRRLDCKPSELQKMIEEARNGKYDNIHDHFRDAIQQFDSIE